MNSYIAFTRPLTPLAIGESPSPARGEGFLHGA